jgi:hypothetical protein
MTMLIEDRSPNESDADWMSELALHFERMRRSYPDDELCIVFDIDGTILDMRHLVVHALLAYDRRNGTESFRGLRPEDVTVHENRIDDFLQQRALSVETRRNVASWVSEQLWNPESVLVASRPYRGVLGVIRWFQLQRKTRVALNTGRPERLRSLTLDALNSIGRAHRVTFASDLLCMNPHGWNRDVADSKVSGIRKLQTQGMRIFAVVDNEPANIRAMAEADDSGEILFLHADTIFESQREVTPRTVSGSAYDLAGLVSERELATRVELVWHGVNDEPNLRQFLSSGVRWAEGDVRFDPFGRLVLRHDGYEESLWSRAESPLALRAFLQRIRDAGRAAKIDLKEGGPAVQGVLEEVRNAGLERGALWFNGSVEVLGEEGIRRIVQDHPGAIVSAPIDFLGPLLLADPDLAGTVLNRLSEWGINRASIQWLAPGNREVLDRLEAFGWDVNIYGVPDLESFLEAALLLPRSVTADFNFPDWNYYGRGAGQRRSHHRYALVDAG